MTRILAISHDASLYGAQRSLLDAVVGLTEAGHEVHVCAPAGGDLVELLRARRVPVHLLRFGRWIPARPGGGIIDRLLFLARFPTAVLRAVRLIRAGRFDVVYTNTVTVLEFAVAAWVAQVPHVWHLRESAAANPQLRSPLSNKAVLMVVRALSRRVIYNSRHLLARYGEAATAKDVIVHNGFRPSTGQGRSTKPGGPDAVFEILTAGFMNRRKGLDVLLDALSLLEEDLRRRVVLRVAGHLEPGEMAREIAPRLERVGVRVEFLGWVADMESLLATADLVISSARDEPFGRTLVEAMMAGVPVLATRSGGPEEIVVNGVTGVLVPSEDPPNLCAALTGLLRDPRTMRAYGRAGRDHALAQFSLASYVGGIEACLVQAMSEGVRVPFWRAPKPPRP